MITTIFTGRLGADAELKTVSDSKQVLEFTVAVDTGFGDHKKTLWIKCSKWGDKTAVKDFLKKGTQVCIAGEPSVHAYTNKDGVAAAQMQLRVDKLELLGSKQAEGQQQAVGLPPATAVDAIDDLPF